MRTVLGHKINVTWMPNPYFGMISSVSDATEDSRTEFPVLMVDNKLRELQAIGGVRAKYFHRNKFVVKISDSLHDTNDFIATWNSISKKDRKYFPKVLAIDVVQRYIVQEYVPLKPIRGRASKSMTNLVLDLAYKYDLSDIGGSWNKFNNWGINDETGDPVIFDFISIGN